MFTHVDIHSTGLFSGKTNWNQAVNPTWTSQFATITESIIVVDMATHLSLQTRHRIKDPRFLM